jgi:hypothetical protein
MKWCVNRVRLSFIVSALLVLVSSQGASGTVVYLRVEQEEVVITADSKRVVVKPDGSMESISVCKIGQAGDVFFVSAGIGGDTGAGFDVGQIARQAISGEGPLAKQAHAFQQLIHIPLVKTLEIIREREPARYKGFLRGAAAQTVFIRIENQSPIVAASIIAPVEDSNGAIKLKTDLYLCPGNCKLPNTLSVGSSHGADQIEEKTENFWGRGAVAGVRELMRISIADYPRETGEPIDILRINKSGATWAQVKPGCDEGAKIGSKNH